VSGDPVTEACEQYAGYMARLEDMIGEPVADGQPGVSRPANAPEPYGQAGRALMTGHEGVRRLEASLRLATSGHTGRRRGGSQEHTDAALDAIPKLAAGLPREAAEEAAYTVGQWIADARSCHGIDEARRLRRLPRRDGELLPPRCPYCLTYNLVADLDARLVGCAYPKCPGDRNGDPPVASMATSSDGRAQLAWRDGLTELAPDLED
jgi:hypothetical protein